MNLRRIEKYLNHFYKHEIFLVMSAELEFYLNDESHITDIERNVKLIDSKARITREIGTLQFEINTGEYCEVCSLIKSIISIREMIPDHGGIISPKPKLDEPGNALQVNFYILNSEKKNILLNERFRIKVASKLCSSIKKNMLYFAPYPCSYKRFQYYDRYTPTTISWSISNRNSAVRIKHFYMPIIEHRVLGMDADIENSILGIIVDIHDVLSGKEVEICDHNYYTSSPFNFQFDRIPFSYTESQIYFMDD